VRLDSIPSLTTATATARPSPSGVPALLPIGRLTVLAAADGFVGTTVTMLDTRSVTTMVLPAPLIARSALHSSFDGAILSGLLIQRTNVIVWLYDARTRLSSAVSTDLPVPADEPVVVWSPDGRHAAYIPNAAASAPNLFVVDLFGRTQQIGVHGAFVYDVEWRSDHELSLMINESSPVYPLNGATLVTWDLDHPGIPQLVANVRAASGVHLWSPDGTAVIYGDMDAVGGPDRFVRRAPQGTNVVFGADDVRGLANACDLRGQLSFFFGMGWSPDGQRFATIGKMPPSECCWFLAIGSVNGGSPPALFRAPSSCYLNGSGGWVDNDRLLVELTGPSCGATDRLGRGVIVDARSGSVISEFPVGRKSALTLSPDGRWVANAYDGGIDIIPLADTAKRIVLPVNGLLVAWCCP